ncbi:MAG: S-methyl-5-thioribose-1-phosphate isomerase [Planctomycetota bacterium]
MIGDDQTIRPVQWLGGLDGYVALIDQTLLPEEFKLVRVESVEAMWDAIRRLVVRGAPAIGIAAAMGVVLGVRECAYTDEAGFGRRLTEVCAYLRTARPTAVNLFWALQRMAECAEADAGSGVAAIKAALLREAQAIRDEDAASCRKIGENGAPLITEGCGVLTHCNAGALATAEYGTALAPMYVAHGLGRSFRVYVDETRPLLQGARLTTWELQRAGVDVTLICDSMAAVIMRQGRVNLVITGADRIAANGDVANKIGTYGLAVLARAHGIPFYVATPSSTFDLSLPDGRGIPIEERDPDEIRRGLGRQIAPPDVPCYSPAFDVTPAKLIRGIITDRGVIEPVSAASIAAVLGRGAG